MRKFLLFTFLLYSFFGITNSQNLFAKKSRIFKSKYLDINSLPNSLLWEISGKGLKKPSYLFGTVHMICDSNFIIKPKVEHAIRNSDHTYLEIDINQSNQEEIMKKFMISGYKISDSLSKEDAIFLNKYLLKTIHLPLEQLDMLEPMIVSSLIIQLGQPCQLISYEGELAHITAKYNHTLDGLSSFEEQYGYVKSSMTVAKLMQSLRDLEKGSLDSLVRMIVVPYEKEDINQIAILMNEYENDEAPLIDKLLRERNEKWLKKIIPELSQRSLFIAVGAAHLPGKNGLIDLLQQAGYKIKPIFK